VRESGLLSPSFSAKKEKRNRLFLKGEDSKGETESSASFRCKGEIGGGWLSSPRQGEGRSGRRIFLILSLFGRPPKGRGKEGGGGGKGVALSFRALRRKGENKKKGEWAVPFNPFHHPPGHHLGGGKGRKS